MIEIKVENLGKRFNRDWIFRHWTTIFAGPSTCAILGGNGSGKSTALKLLLGYAVPSEGQLTYFVNGAKLSSAKAYRYFSFCSPYLELYEELSLLEMAKFHFSLKPILPDFSIEDFMEQLHLRGAADKPVKYFSSGMKQRLRLGLALYSATEGVFLDEPISNLDRSGIDWYHETLQKLSRNRLIIIGSNHQQDELFGCGQKIEISELKPA